MVTSGTIPKAQRGSAHHQRKAALAIRPTSKTAERYRLNCDYLASACIVRLLRSSSTLFLKREREGITSNESDARMIPARLDSGFLCLH
jgi:hypothetical protein